MRRTMILLVLVGLAVVLSSTAAFAAINKVTCKAGAVACKGTNKKDAVMGSAAGDDIRALAGNDKVTGAAGNDAIDGGTGNDVYYYNRARSGNDILQDASGTDTVNFTALSTSVTVDLQPAVPFVTPIQIHNPLGGSPIPVPGFPVITAPLSTVGWPGGETPIENVVGGQSSDNIRGSQADNAISGGGGNDFITTGVGGGNDVYSGGEDADMLMLTGFGARASGGPGSDYLVASFDPGIGTSTFSGEARLAGEGGDDNISGGPANDDLSGGPGRDYLSDGGQTSNDVYRFVRGFGGDTVSDFGGMDTANLEAYKLAEVAEVWNADLTGGFIFGGSDGNIDSRVIEFKDGSMVAFMGYYNNTSPFPPLTLGTGVIEQVRLKDGNLSLSEMNAMSSNASARQESQIESLVADPPEADEVPKGVEMPGITD